MPKSLVLEMLDETPIEKDGFMRPFAAAPSLGKIPL